MPSSIDSQLERIARIAKHVRDIDAWKSQVNAVDSIKRVFVESICEAYAIYVDEVDSLQMRHHGIEEGCSIDDLLAIVSQWHERINYVHSLVEATRDKCGMEMMNIAFSEWCMQCVADWSYE